MNHRIKEVRCALGLTQDEFGRRLGVGRGVITNIEFEKTTPKDTFIGLLCREFHVSEAWIRYGEGDMFISNRNEEIQATISEILADEDDAFRKRLIAALCALDVDEWKVLEKISQKVLESTKNPDEH